MVNFESQVKQDFPNFYIPLPEVRFPFKEVNMLLAYDLITTQYPLQSHTGAHSRRFPHQFLLLVLFCKCDFKMQSFLISAKIRRLYHLSQAPSRKTSYTTHSFRHIVGFILSRTKSIIKNLFSLRIGFAQEQVSTNIGSVAVCHYGRPRLYLSALTPNWA